MVRKKKSVERNILILNLMFYIVAVIWSHKFIGFQSKLIIIGKMREPKLKRKPKGGMWSKNKIKIGGFRLLATFMQKWATSTSIVTFPFLFQSQYLINVLFQIY